MNRSRYLASLMSAQLLATLALTGCAGFHSIPDTVVATQNALGTIHGSNFGGHAPMVGAKMFVLSPGTSGYGSAAVDLLNVGSTSNSSYPVALDLTGNSINNPTFGMYYVSTDGYGGFNISGDYTCTTGAPVYLYAYGGDPSGATGGVFNITAISTVTAGSGSTEVATLNATGTLGSGNLAAGQYVRLSGLTGALAGLNGTVQLVIALSAHSGTISVGDPYGAIQGTYGGLTATATSLPGYNPAAVNIAVLGNCPSTGNFSTGPSALQFVYMNEVSTAAAAYAFAGFTSRSNNDMVHIGSSSTTLGLQGIANAALNAGLLYDIQGGNTSNTPVGEGHIARAITPQSVSGNVGTVEQAKLDTLGNLLANCVDSGNTFNPITGLGNPQSQCSTLFSFATANGAIGGVAPLDTATAMLNVALFPSGAPSNPTFVHTLYTLPGAVVPFTPNLTSTGTSAPALGQPTDFTVGIKFTAPGIDGPVGLAVDGTGNVWVSNYFATNGLVELNASGVANVDSPFTVPAARGVVIDSADNAWATSQGHATIYKVNPAGGVTPVALSGGIASTFGIAVDASSNLVVSDLLNPAIYRYSPTGGTPLNTYTNCASTPSNGAAAGGIEPYITLDHAGNIWASGSYASQTYCELSSTGAAISVLGGFRLLNAVAIDQTGNAWLPQLYQNSGAVGPNLVMNITPGPSSLFTKYQGNSSGTASGGLFGPAAVAIDGANNVWVANANNNSVSELANSGIALTTTGYRRGGSVHYQANIAVDGSGDLWTGFTGLTAGDVTSVTEIIGAATPVVTPVAVATANGTLGQTP